MKKTLTFLLVLSLVFLCACGSDLGMSEEAAEEINANDEVKVDFDTGVITNLTTGKTYKAQPFPPFIQNIIKCGGLLKSLKEGENNG